MNVFSVPTELDHQAVDQVLDMAGQVGIEHMLFDARHVRWIDPNGMVALLAAGAVVKKQGGSPRLQLPDNSDVLEFLSYWVGCQNEHLDCQTCFWKSHR